MTLKPGSTMLWKPSTVQLRNVKAKNCGSFFLAKQVKEPPAVREVGLVKNFDI